MFLNLSTNTTSGCPNESCPTNTSTLGRSGSSSFFPAFAAKLDDLNHAFNEHGVSQQQINVNIGDSVFTSGPGYVGHLRHKREKGTLCGDGQVRFHSGSAVGADKVQEVLAVLGRGGK